MRAYVMANHGDDEPGLVGDRLVQRGYRLTVLLREDCDGWPQLDDADLLVSLGSEWSVYWDHVAEPVQAEVALLRKAHERGMPVLGICFGSQLMATALGAHVERAPAVDVEIGWYDVVPVPGAPGVVGGRWFQWHYDRWAVPLGAERLAETAGANQAFRHGRTLAVQYHPEVTPAVVSRWAGLADGDELRVSGIDPVALVAETERLLPDVTMRTNALVDWFCDEVAGS
jgi:GMP synthase-like glutamine amidotransferase